ncbi:GNAT family N-acetyltransferase [Streptomyces sp. YIM 98790]|uniref:GNAT family N-acetyltransferase n=1 Tax=Streptomyces sp. YIM 98790 TaxID=2689077 RepID=UPI00140AE3A9|nr:GNAT family N-acetyltransferase [Streptomyces sp. YIM 98790]
MEFVTVPFDHPDASKLNDLVQQEYHERYGDGGDRTVLDPGMFAPPNGLFLVVYDGLGRPVGSGGWRAQDCEEEGYSPGDAELKRMFVVREARRRGLSRLILARLEEDARAAGRRRMVLETGDQQPEAIALYRSSGYLPAPRKFGYYRCHESSICFAKQL